MKTTRFIPLTMHQELSELLLQLRVERGFSAQRYIQAKSLLLHKYFRKHKLSGAVIGVSGGIDSAAALAILANVKKMPESPLKVLQAVSLPYFDTTGATNQDSATDRGRAVAAALSVSHVTIDLGNTFKIFSKAISSALNTPTNDWVDGQGISYMRTPALYQVATILGEAGTPSIVCGTTNRDEGAYLGFFGKASDGMVDLQIISDLHKSEVYAVAKLLGVPACTLGASPTGDVYDGATHAEMIGTSYDFVELYLLLLERALEEKVKEKLSSDALENFTELSRRIELMHSYNMHKYLGGNPSVHLDVMPRGVRGGWHDNFYKSTGSDGVGRKLVGEFTLSTETIALFSAEKKESVVTIPLGDLGEKGTVIEKLLTKEECSALLQEVRKEAKIPVGYNGYVKDYTPGKDAIGSYRATAYTPEVAGVLWSRLAPYIQKLRVFDDRSMTDSGDAQVWKAIGINPAMRFIWYEKGGSLIPHYDAGYDFKDSKRHTLVSLILYLTDGEEGKGGATRFLLDQQRNLPSSERDYSDWTRLAEEHEVLLKVEPAAGKAILFDHRIVHDAEPWSGIAPRVIVRTDIIFERCDTMGVISDPSTAVAAQCKEEVIGDPFYRSVQKLGGNTKAAGYFSDGFAQIDEKLRSVLVTPLYKLLNNVSGVSEPVVLVTTGGFAPLHNGHIEMLESAKQIIEARGEKVVGGYIIPDHDEYVQKKCGECWIPASERVAWCERATKEHPWIMIDPWAAMYAPASLNFTSILLRLERYLAQHIRTLAPIKLVYVCGHDNEGLADAFIRRGSCVLVPRKGAVQTSKRHLSYLGEGRVTTGTKETLILASRNIRGGDYGGLPKEIVAEVTTYLSQKKCDATISLFLRDEEIKGNLFGETLTSDAYAARAYFLSNLKSSMTDTLKATQYFSSIAVETFRVEDQLKEYERLYRADRHQTISLDECFKGDFRLSVSRAFQCPGAARETKLVPRPDSLTLEEQIRSIPSGSYTLVEDDIATGHTIRAVMKLLPERIQVDNIVELSKFSFKEKIKTVEATHGKDICDVGDVRDFIVGAKHGGLVVKLPTGEFGRAPYAMPYVKLSERMSMPRSTEMRLSRIIWILNKKFYRKLRKKFKIKDCDSPFRRFAQYLGFDEETTLEDFCGWHAELIKMVS